MPSAPTYVFPPFRLSPDLRLLAADDMPLKLGGRAFDTLLALVERRDRGVSKQELLDIVWPRLVVEENNLQVQVATLRKLLGHHAIATIPGRGYRFTMPVEVQGGHPPTEAARPPAADSVSADTAGGRAATADASSGFAASPSAGAAPTLRPGTSPPQRHDALFGREADVAAVLAMLGERRVVTIAGAGGIGKTRVAEAAATAAAGPGGAYADGVWWVELAAIADPALVPTAVARALGLWIAGTRDTLQSIVARIGDRSMLLVLDNCEHLLDGVAAFVDAMGTGAPRMRILLTSQEVLRANDEQVVRLGTLDLPGAPTPDAVSASGCGALLLARVRAAMPGFAYTADNAPAAAEICRRLDGIPLAIELAAARVPLLGIEGVRAKLDERFRMLTAGSRVVLRRHQTLRAALEWSHALLTEQERVVFRRLGVFAGGFTLESAQRVADDDDIDAWDVLEHLGALVDKSLVLAEGGAVPRYRLLETTRLYALEQLADAGETSLATRKHAEAITTLLAAFDSPRKRWRTTPADWAAAAAELDNTRVALDWADHQPEATSLCLELASASFYAFTFANVVGEGLRRVVALSRKPSGDVSDEVRASFLLAQARLGIQMAHVESLDAALSAEATFAALGQDECRYVALTCAVAIGARIEADVDVEALIARAAALEQPVWPLRLTALFQWARHRWLLRQGRPELAIAHARRQVELTRASGAERTAALLMGSNVAYCELGMGRVDVAEELARAALSEGGGSDEAAGHALDTWTMCLALQGRLDDALAAAHRAYADLEASGDEFMMYDGLGLIAALQGRLRDAVVCGVLSDSAFEARRFCRWPLSVEWRRRTDALLAGVPADEIARWRRDAEHLPTAQSVRHALGLAAAMPERGPST